MLAEQFDFLALPDRLRRGGATGQLCLALASRHPHLRCISYDMPVVAPIAEETIRVAGLSDCVSVASGDFFAEPLPRADVITMGYILHDWNSTEKSSSSKPPMMRCLTAGLSSSSKPSLTTPGARTSSG